MTSRRCRTRCWARLRHRRLALPCPRGRGSTTSAKRTRSRRYHRSWYTRFCRLSTDSVDVATADGAVDSNDGVVVASAVATGYSRYNSLDYRTENHRYRYPVPPRRSLGAQGSRGRGNQDSTRDPLYCRGCCNRQRRRGDL